jgi:hypothetical protein
MVNIYSFSVVLFLFIGDSKIAANVYVYAVRGIGRLKNEA